MNAWLGTVIALAALALSAATAYQQHRSRGRESRAAEVTAYFHRTAEFARVKLPDGTIREAGYHLVIWNRGPAPATAVRIELAAAEGDPVELADLGPDEFPLPRIDRDGRYPLPWLPTGADHRGDRRFTVRLHWQDGNGPQERLLPLRKGQTNL
ncbi:MULTISPECIES: hypothetical protein [Kitasatospora]|uniref:Uncharacterized protein n=1 Tax=Kitasatospora setae (strain ATCC 33774 / DSM 43861 / JCM 3304 / KCC A-0304 / NBRC 14216 / KM-6054) TaxID=452652 RepID=E4N6S4_KITSK|nr:MULTISPECIES: hypothetical protein [Kitasatospora]BAJ26905.1 hypothetical protein KSE_10710 [Kitasatospora setae KM-6054]